MTTPSSVPGPPDTTTSAATSAIPAIGAPVHTAVPGTSTPDTSPEILAGVIAKLFDHPDVVWHSGRLMAWQEKANFLRLDSKGDFWLDVIKPWVRFSIGVHIDGTEFDLAPMKRMIQQQGDWMRTPEGFLPPWVSSNKERLDKKLEFDTRGGTRPEAVYIFDRVMVLREWANGGTLGLLLRWIGKHTNPAKGERNFQVDDTLQLETF